MEKIVLKNDVNKIIHLEKYKKNHIKDIFNILDIEIWEKIWWDVKSSIEELEKYINKEELIFWSIFLNEKLVWWIFLDLAIKKNNVWERKTANIWYFIDKNYRWNSCAWVSTHFAINYAFNELKITRLKAGHLENNLISKKIIEKNWFKLIGIERNYAKPTSSEKYLNHYLYDMTFEDFLNKN
jgi:RimJ/RimL family protein N-acetyltransferase